jgi:hypothetical protein
MSPRSTWGDIFNGIYFNRRVWQSIAVNIFMDFDEPDKIPEYGWLTKQVS